MTKGMSEVSTLTETDVTYLRIGQVAERIGISERTLRYYEELGLIIPSAYSRGDNRLYDDLTVKRVDRIRTLQSLMGFNLGEIKDILLVDDHLDELRAEYRSESTKSKEDLLLDAMTTLKELQSKVLEKQSRLKAFEDDLEARIQRVLNRIGE